jgi:hypothetical protein
LPALLRDSATALFENPGSDPGRREFKDGRWPHSFASRLDGADNKAKRNPHFAGRNEAFRPASRKPLKFLREANQAFRGIVCFQRLGAVFISPF